MAKPFKFYLNHMNSKTGYRANWEPNRPLEIGMIGKLNNGVLDIFSSLLAEGFEPEILKDKSSGEIDYTSHDAVDINIKLAGKVPLAGSVLTDAEAGFTLEFKKQHAVVFQAKETLTHQITNMGKIGAEIVQRFKDGKWPKDWLVITQLVEATSATIIISNSSNNKLELKATANVGTTDLKLTDASLGLTVARETGSSLKIIGESGITPLYRVMGISRPPLGKPTIGVKGVGEVEDETFQYQDWNEEELEAEPAVDEQL